jgi:hypothetical protein
MLPNEQKKIDIHHLPIAAKLVAYYKQQHEIRSPNFRPSLFDLTFNSVRSRITGDPLVPGLQVHNKPDENITPNKHTKVLSSAIAIVSTGQHVSL